MGKDLNEGLERRIREAYMAGAPSFLPAKWDAIVETAVAIRSEQNRPASFEARTFESDLMLRRQRRDPHGIHLPSNMIAVKIQHILMVEKRLAELEKELAYLKQDEEAFQRLRDHLLGVQVSEAAEDVRLAIRAKERAHLQLVPEVGDPEEKT